MRVVEIRLEDLARKTVPLGFAGENLRTRVRFDCASLFSEYPAAAACLTVSPPRGHPYPGTVIRDGNRVIWDVTDADLAGPGTGKIQLAFAVDGVIAKSCIGQTYTGLSITPQGPVPAPLEDWLIRAETALARIPEHVPEIRINTEEYWNSQTACIPPRGCLVVYTDHGRTEDGRDVPALKIGDGDAYLADLPFITGTDPDLVRRLEDHLLDPDIHATPAEKERWNNKLNCEVEGTTLVLNRN